MTKYIRIPVVTDVEVMVERLNSWDDRTMLIPDRDELDKLVTDYFTNLGCKDTVVKKLTSTLMSEIMSDRGTAQIGNWLNSDGEVKRYCLATVVTEGEEPCEYIESEGD